MHVGSSHPQAPPGGQKVIMKAPPGMINANGKMMMMAPPGATPAGMVGGKKIMMAPPGAAQMMGKSMMSTASSAPHAGMMMAPGAVGTAPMPGMKKVMAVPPGAGMKKMMYAGPPSSLGQSLGSSAAPHPGVPAYATTNGERMMLPPGAKFMGPPGPHINIAAALNASATSSGAAQTAASAMARPAGAGPGPGSGYPSPSPRRVDMRAGSPSPPAALSATESRTATPAAGANPNAMMMAARTNQTAAKNDNNKPGDEHAQKRRSLFSFLRAGGSSSSDDDETPFAAPAGAPPVDARRSTQAPPASTSPVRHVSPTPAAPVGFQGKKMVKTMVGAPGSAAAGAAGPSAPAGAVMKKFMVAAPQGVGVKTPAATAGATNGSAAPPASSGVKFIGMPQGSVSGGYNGSASLTSVVLPARAGPAGVTTGAAPTPAPEDVDTASDVLLHSDASLERMAAAAVAPASTTPFTSTPTHDGTGIRVASTTKLGGDAASSLRSAGVAPADKAAKAKPPITRVSGRFAAFAVGDSDEDSSADEAAGPSAVTAAAVNDDGGEMNATGTNKNNNHRDEDDQDGLPSRAQTPGERAGTAHAATSDDEDVAGSATELSASVKAAVSSGLAQNASVKLSLASGDGGSTQPPHTREPSRDSGEKVSSTAHKTTAARAKPKSVSPLPVAGKKVQKVAATPQHTRERPTRSPSSSMMRKAVASPSKPTTAVPKTSQSLASRVASTATAKKKPAAMKRQPSASTLGGVENDDDGADDVESVGTAATERGGDITISDEENDDAVVEDSAPAHSRANNGGNKKHKKVSVNADTERAKRHGHGSEDDDDGHVDAPGSSSSSSNADFFDDKDAEVPGLSSRDIYRLVSLLKKEEKEGGARSRSHSRTRAVRRDRSADAWDHLGARRRRPFGNNEDDRHGDDTGRLREPYAVHLHSTREIIGSPGIPWRYTDRHSSSEPFPPAPSVSRPLGVINVGGGRYSTLRTPGTTSPYVVPAAHQRSRSAEVVVRAGLASRTSPQRGGGRGGDVGSDAHDLYTSSILEDLSHSAIRAAQQYALGLPSRSLGGSGLSPEGPHPYCASPPRPLLSAVPVSRGASPLRAATRPSDATGTHDKDRDTPVAATRSTPPPSQHTPSFFDAHRQMYFGAGTSRDATPHERAASRPRERLLVSPLRDELRSSQPPARERPEGLGMSLSYRDSPLLLRPTPMLSASAVSSSAQGGRRPSAEERKRTPAASMATRVRAHATSARETPSLLPASLAPSSSKRATSTPPARAAANTPEARKPARLTAATIERLATPPRHSASVPRNYQDFVHQSQRRARSGATRRASASRCSKWVDEVLSAMSETPRDDDAGGAASARTPVQIPVIDMRTAFKPVVLDVNDDDATRQRKLNGILANDVSEHGFIGSRARPHVPGFSFKSMTGVRSPVPSAASESPQRQGRRRSGSGVGPSSVGASAVKSVANLPPSEGLPFDQYSTVKVKDPQRPSAWALTPERDAELGGVLPGQAAVRRVVRRGGAGGSAEGAPDDDADDCYDTVEEVRLDEFRRPYVVISRIPRGAAAQRQMQSAKRLSLPKKRYVRADGDA